jgi:hypothetical protein
MFLIEGHELQRVYSGRRAADIQRRASMERLERESACDDLKAGEESITSEGKYLFQGAASKFKWARPLNAYAKPDIHR